MKMTVTKFLEGKNINRRALQRNIKAALDGDEAAKKRLREKHNITSVEAISTRMYMVNVKPSHE